MRIIGMRTIGKFKNLNDLQEAVDKKKLSLMIDCGWVYDFASNVYELKVSTR